MATRLKAVKMTEKIIRECWGNFDCLLLNCWEVSETKDLMNCLAGEDLPYSMGTKWYWVMITIGAVLRSMDVIKFALDRVKHTQSSFYPSSVNSMLAELDDLPTHDWYAKLPFNKHRFIRALEDITNLGRMDTYVIGKELLVLLLVAMENFDEIKAIFVEHSSELSKFMQLYGVVDLVEHVRKDPGYVVYFSPTNSVVSSYLADISEVGSSYDSDLVEVIKAALRSADYFAKDYVNLSSKISHDVEQKVESFKSQVKKPFSFVVTLADLHIGEHVNVAGFTYDLTVFRDRFAEYSSVAKHLAEKLNPDEIVIISLGDLISGIIHEEFMRSLTTASEWIMIAIETIAVFVEMLSKYAPVRFVGVYGNHGRMRKRVHYKGRQENFDYIIYKMLEFHFNMLERKDISFEVPIDPYHYTQIQDFNFVIAHGDDVRAWMNYPFYGVSRQAAKLKLLKRSDPPDYLILGHFHMNNNFDHFYGEVFNVGSMKGPDEYSVAKVPILSRPSQLLFIVERGRGVTIRWPYYFD